MGKPRLADAVALRLEPTYDGGVRWVNLRESKTPEELAAACLARSVRAIFEPRWGALSPEGEPLPEDAPVIAGGPWFGEGDPKTAPDPLPSDG